MKHYNECVENITRKLETLIQVISDSRNMKEEEDFEHTKIGQKVKSKSRVKIKEEEMLKSRVRRLARRNYNSLGTYIRLIDYWVTETQVQIN